MAVVVSEDSIQEQTRYRRPSRNQSILPSSSLDPSPTPQISPLLQSTRCKPTISSIFLSTFSTNSNNNINMSSSSPSSSSSSSSSSSALKNKKKNFTSATFRGFGCTTTSSQVSAPTVIRTSADWQAKKVRKKKQRNPQRKKNQQQTSTINNPTPVVVVPDVWCAPGIGFSADSAAPVDCVVSRRPVQGRGRTDAGERVNHRERSCISRRTAHVEHLSILDSPSAFETSHIESDVFGARNHRHFRHRSPGGLSEIMMFQNSTLLGGRPEGYDRYRDLRLDVDSMSYEELLELGDRIGYVSTGLIEDDIVRCLRKTKHSILDALQSHLLTETNWKCSICQEEYEADDEVGKLDCGHNYHICCIKQWLLQKNACPVCKVAVKLNTKN